MYDIRRSGSCGIDSVILREWVNLLVVLEVRWKHWFVKTGRESA